MAGLSLVTKGFISPISVITGTGGGGGSPPVFREEHLPKPLVTVTRFDITGTAKEPVTEESFKVKTIKVV